MVNESNLSQIGARSLSGSSSDDKGLRQIKMDQRKAEPSLAEKARHPKTYKDITMVVDRAEGLKTPHRHLDTIDPYLVVKHADYKVKSNKKKNAGTNTQFRETFTIPTTDKKYVA